MVKRNLLQTTVTVLKLCSMYPCDDNANFLIKIGYFLFKVVNVLVLYFLAIPLVYETTLGGKVGITAYSLNIVNICAYGCSCLTIHFFHIRGTAVRDLIIQLNKIFKYKSDGQISEENMERITQLSEKITLWFTVFLDLAVVMMALFPLFSSSSERFLPVPGAYPFNYKESPIYEIIYVIQVYTQVIVGSLTGAGDTFFICMLLLTAQQFHILSTDFQNCLYNTLSEYAVPKNVIINFKDKLESLNICNILSQPYRAAALNIPRNAALIDDNYLLELITSEKFNSKLKETFINYIKHHQMLLTFCEQMENFFWPFILMKTAISMFYNIFITFALVTSNDASVWLPLTQYELCAILELFAYAVAGQALLTKSQDLQDMLYSSPWYICNDDYKKLLYVVQIRSGRTVRISVGKLYDMSLATFVMVMKTAMSYLAVLRQMTE